MKRIAIVCLALAIALASSCEKMSTDYGKLKVNVTERTLNGITFDLTVNLPENVTGYIVGAYCSPEDPMQVYNDDYTLKEADTEEGHDILINRGYSLDGIPGKFTYTIEYKYLTPGDYYVRAYIGTINQIIKWGPLTKVSTGDPKKPVVTITDVDVYSNSIKVEYDITGSEVEPLNDGFYLSSNRSDLEKKKGSLQAYHNRDMVNGLEMDKDYYIQAFAENVSGTGYSEIMTVRTKKHEDLSAEETANCYIVSKAGHYAFNAFKATKRDTLAEATRAEVYWETVNTGTKPEAGTIISKVYFNKKTNLIEFDATGTPGNALIALYNDNPEIVWSWHIWSTEQPKDQVYSNNAGTMMDRNLGALSTSKEGNLSRGMLYQWGRKDPLPGSLEGKSDITCTKNFIPKDSKQAYAYSVKNPAQAINGRPDWCTDVAAAGRWSATGKTVNDPCPPGYHIPSSSVWVAPLDGTSFKISNSSEWADGYDFATGSYKFGSDTSIWYPVTGAIWEGNQNETITRIDLAYYWADSADSNYVGTFLMMSGSSINVVNTNDAMGRAVAVRCQKN